MTVLAGVLVPGLPHPLLCPDANPGYRRLRDAMQQAGEELRASGADLLLVYSTMWPSIIGHQLQADPEPTWVHVDEVFHHLGSIPYRLRMDADFARAWQQAAVARGLQSRTVAYKGFPIDTGSVVALQLLNPGNALPAVIVSSNVYADRAETMVLGKSARDALAATGRKAAVIVVSTLSNRLFTDWIDPAEDRVHSPKDDEWNRKVLELLGEGRLEDTAQLSRAIQQQIRIKKVVNFKPLWFLSSLMGAHNRYEGRVLAYEGVHGTGSAVVRLTPSDTSVGDKEFDEEDVEVWRGDRGVLGGADTTHRSVERLGPASVATPGRLADLAGLRVAEPGQLAAPVATGVAGPGRLADPAGLRVAEPGQLAAPVATGVAGPGRLAEEDSEEPDSEEPDSEEQAAAPRPDTLIVTRRAPRPVGAYPHARRVGDLLYLSGLGPRQPGTDGIPGGPIRGPDGARRDYDIEAQTRAVIENIIIVLEDAGLRLGDVVDVTTFLVDMDRDFAGYNKVYAEYFTAVQATRTTVAVSALPTPIAVEMKVIARFP
jgi:2-aminophenol/2-amino-5-chlorophenol 1,6-dioxygenase alpha subunit